MKAEKSIHLWVEGARPKTIPAAIVPVLVGTAASADSGFILYRFALALLVSIALQIGVNYANDYSDGIRGTDEDRIGPRRLVGSKLVPDWQVKWASFITFLVAAIAGLILALAISLWIVLIGFAAIIAAWFYTGGSTPYGYLGFGEVSVFVFFGLVGITNGLCNVLGSSTWAEIYGVKYIGSIKALTTALMVFATAFGTAVFGILIDAGFSIEQISLITATYISISMISLFFIRKKINPIKI